MNFNAFSDKARRAMKYARGVAEEHGHDCIQDNHILLGILRDDTSSACAVLEDIGIDPGLLSEGANKDMNKEAKVVTIGTLPFTAEAKKTLYRAIDEAQDQGQDYVGTEHVLLGVALEGTGAAAVFIRDSVSDHVNRLRQAVKRLSACESPDKGRPDPVSIPKLSEEEGFTDYSGLLARIVKIEKAVDAIASFLGIQKKQ